MIRLLCVVEVQAARTIAEAQIKLDGYREATQPTLYGLSIYRAECLPYQEVLKAWSKQAQP